MNLEPFRNVARAITGTSELPEVGSEELVLRPGTITALNASAFTATVTVNGVSVVAKTYAGQPLAVGQNVDVLFQGARARVIGAAGQGGGGGGTVLPAPVYGTFSHQSSPAANTATVAFRHTNLRTPTVACIAVLTMTMNYGFTGADNTAELFIENGYGNEMSLKPKAFTAGWVVRNVAGRWKTTTIIGRRQLAANEAMGAGLSFAVDTSNFYVEGGYELRFEPLP